MSHVQYIIAVAAAVVTCITSQSHTIGFPGKESGRILKNEPFLPFEKLSQPYIQFMDNVLMKLQEGNESSRCSIDTKRMVLNIKNGSSWAITMMDAMGKPSSGILEGGLTFIGFHSECISVKVPGDENEAFKGQYCLLTFLIPGALPVPPQNIPQQSWKMLTNRIPRMSLCIPSTCSEKDVTHAFNAILSSFGGVVVDTACSTDDSDLQRDNAAICVLSLFSLVLLFVALGTVYDVILSIYGSSWRTAWRNCCRDTRDDKVTNSTDMLCPVPAAPSNNSSGITFGKILLTFSAKTNGKKILDMNTPPESSITCLHGLRSLSMILIIFGHTYSFATQWLFFRNPSSAAELPKGLVAQTFANMTFAVDTFLYLSGFLVTYLTLKTMDKTSGKLNVPLFYFHRFIRMTPLMMAVIAFCAVVMRHVGSGPNWLGTIKMYDVWCRENWWTNLIYLNNFIHRETMCLSHTWYSAVDMQYYILTPLILIPLHRRFKWGALVWCFLLLTTITVTAVLTAVNNYPATAYIGNVVPMTLMNDYYGSVYIKPYCRMGPYLIGIAMGYLMHITQGDFTLKKKYVALCWIVSITGNLAVLYSMWHANEGILPTVAGAATYSAVARTVWAIGLAWLTFACVTGSAGFVNTILSWRALLPSSRLTYAAYIIHPVVMSVFYGMFENTVDFSVSFMVYLFIGNMAVTYTISFFLSLMFESPIVTLERLLLRRK